MRYRTIKKLRSQIWKYRQREWYWKDICNKLDILTEDGRPDTGLAHDIGYKTIRMPDGKDAFYEPTDADVRERLGLSPVCQECHRPLRSKEHRELVRKKLPEHMQWWKNRTPLERSEYIQLLFNKYG